MVEHSSCHPHTIVPQVLALTLLTLLHISVAMELKQSCVCLKRGDIINYADNDDTVSRTILWHATASVKSITVLTDDTLQESLLQNVWYARHQLIRAGAE